MNDYIITSLCFGDKYIKVLDKWNNRIINKCNINPKIIVLTKDNIERIRKILNIKKIDYNKYAWWDIFRLKNNLILLEKLKKPIVNIDLDIIIEKNIEDIIKLPYDIIISKEIGENKAYPLEYSEKLGFGVCTGFYCLKEKSINIMKNICENMINKENYSDQYNIMEYIYEKKEKINKIKTILNNKEYINIIIEIENIKICILDFEIIIRDPIINNNQYGNHINIDNVGGSENYLKYYDNNLEELPLTCRCGKKNLNDNRECIHIKMRNLE